jgi:hypothetical protein
MNPRGRRCLEGTKNRWVYCLVIPIIDQLGLIFKMMMMTIEK